MEVVTGLFKYNREGYKFSNEMKQKDLYQRQKMRVKQFELYREDLRDLFGLTIGKMDNYMIVNTLLLGICIEMYYKGRSPPNTPSWLFWAWSISLISSIFYLLLSIWFSLHASVHAQTFAVRSLTQWLRLPIPSSVEISEGAAKLEDYEQSGLNQMFRIPFTDVNSQNGLISANNQGESTQSISKESGSGYTPPLNTDTPQSNNKHNPPMDQTATSKNYTSFDQINTDDLDEKWTDFSKHFKLFNQLHLRWSGHEAYARVCMAIGTNQLLSSISYFALSYYCIDFDDPWSGLVFVILCSAASLLHIKMNLLLTNFELFIMILLQITAPLFLSIASVHLAIYREDHPINDETNDLLPNRWIRGSDLDEGLALIAHIGHFSWMIFFLWATRGDGDRRGLPVKFSTVWTIDILGFGQDTIVDSDDITHDDDRQQDDYTSSKRTKEEMEKLTKISKNIEASIYSILKEQIANNVSINNSEMTSNLIKRFNKDRLKLAKLLGNTDNNENDNLWLQMPPIIDSANTTANIENRNVRGDDLNFLSTMTIKSVKDPYFLNLKTGEIKLGEDDIIIDKNRNNTLLNEDITTTAFVNIDSGRLSTDTFKLKSKDSLVSIGSSIFDFQRNSINVIDSENIGQFDRRNSLNPFIVTSIEEYEENIGQIAQHLAMNSQDNDDKNNNHPTSMLPWVVFKWGTLVICLSWLCAMLETSLVLGGVDTDL